ncbi:MAG: DNA repair protein RadA [Flavobacteriaceae bacterium]
MSKVKTAFFCQNCGSQFSKWQGQCNSCKSWNTIVEELITTSNPKGGELENSKKRKKSTPIKINQIDGSAEVRMRTGDKELDNVLGGGIVPGSLTLLGGEPGIGKSTLLLQIALRLPYKTLYVSGEESLKQVKMRAERIHPGNNHCFILSETNSQLVIKQITDLNPDVVVVDSIQTLHSSYIEASAGSVSQIKACTSELIAFAKKSNIPIVLIGHITKEGHLAGPKILEHMVDTVLQFEGDRNHIFRILRAHKNRFGSTHELGIYEMLGSGLRPVSNPSEILISKKDEVLSGNVIAASLEGMRPLMIEIQALVSTAVYGTPQRSATGFNLKRLHMLLAVLEKRVGFKLGAKDVFLNITGGISVDDTAIDLAVVAAILSSNEDLSVSQDFCFAAEIGLSGEIRPVQRIDQRITEAEKLGFKSIFVSKYNKINLKNVNIRINEIATVEELVGILF